MSENQLSADLIERLASVDSKLEKLLASQPVIKKEGLTKTRNLAEPTGSEKILPDPSEDDDIPEAFEAAASPQNPSSLRTNISPVEADAILQKVQKINSDAEVLGRVKKLERQYRKITILGSMVMTLMVMMLGVFAFFMVHGNRGVFFQASQTGKPPKALSMEAPTKVNSPPPAEPMAKVNGLKTAKPMAKASDLKSVESVASDPKPVEPVAPVTDPQKAEATAPVKYVGSITSNKYHYPDCKWAANIKPYKLRTFSSANEAREMGYIPCPTCRPPQSDQ